MSVLQTTVLRRNARGCGAGDVRRRGPVDLRFTEYPSVDAALAAAGRRPCRRGCQRVHLIAIYGDNYELSGVQIIDDRIHRGLAAELRALYGEPIHPNPAAWPREEQLEMSLYEATQRANEVASGSIDPSDHAVKNALQGALDAERHRLHRSLDPQGYTDDLPTWSEVCPAWKLRMAR